MEVLKPLQSLLHDVRDPFFLHPVPLALNERRRTMRCTNKQNPEFDLDLEKGAASDQPQRAIENRGKKAFKSPDAKLQTMVMRATVYARQCKTAPGDRLVETYT